MGSSRSVARHVQDCFDLFGVSVEWRGVDLDSAYEILTTGRAVPLTECQVFAEARTVELEYDDFMVKPHDVVSGVLVCGKCGSDKIYSFSKQTRSGDESMTVFAMCPKCKHKWTQ